MLTLSDVYRSDKTLFAKYPEPGKDFEHGDQFDFYAGDYGPHVIHSEEARMLPVVGSDLQVPVGQGAVDKRMVDYYTHTYPETFHPDVIIPYENQDYYKLINNTKSKTLVTLHPYSRIDSEKYYIDPNITFFLNNKQNISKLTDHRAKSDIVSIQEITEMRDFPFVLKSFTGASGDGVRIIHSENDLKKALGWFASEKELLVEQFIESVDNVGVQLLIDENGGVQNLGISRQIVSEQGEYEGSKIQRSDAGNKELEKIAIDAGKKAAQMGFVGICGLDFLQDKSGKHYLIDPNFRLTGATSLIFLRDRIFSETNSNLLQAQQFRFEKGDVKNMIHTNKTLKNQSLFLLSAYQDKVSGIVSGFCIVGGESEEEVQYNKKKVYQKKGFSL